MFRSVPLKTAALNQSVGTGTGTGFGPWERICVGVASVIIK